MIGCESEFDKCMNAELPWAEAGLRPEIEEAEKHVAAVALMLSRERRLEEILKPVDDWMEQNPITPPKPEYPCSGMTGAQWSECYEAHRQVEAQWEVDAQPWRDLREEVFIPLLPQLKTAGFEGSTYDEVWLGMEKYYEPYWAATVVRGQEFDCWGREDCEESWDFTDAEEEHVFGEGFDDFKSPEWNAWSEAEPERIKQHFTNKIALLKANAPEIATLMCNRAGIYE